MRTKKNLWVCPRSVSVCLDAVYVKGLAITHVSLWCYKYTNWLPGIYFHLFKTNLIVFLKKKVLYKLWLKCINKVYNSNLAVPYLFFLLLIDRVFCNIKVVNWKNNWVCWSFLTQPYQKYGLLSNIMILNDTMTWVVFSFRYILAHNGLLNFSSFFP